jgi:uncharacterized protein (DUF608 family)|tara:strand:+ start:202 stop:471 length:270 start_codon:yes stop_codon:yes gene_type:complete
MSIRKKLKIDITFVDNHQNTKRSILLDILSKISDDILDDHLIYNKDQIKSSELYNSVYEYKLEDCEKPYREELINGKWYCIYKSKMNLL